MENSATDTWPTVPLGQILDRSKERVGIRPDQPYKQITVRLWGEGVVLRNKVSGMNIRAKTRYVAREGQFILSRIDARNGAFGLVPGFLDGAVVSNDFPVFNIDDAKLSPRFLEWMSKTRDFVALCRRASEGTTNRVRLQLDRFSATEVPLPPKSHRSAQNRRALGQFLIPLVIADFDEGAAEAYGKVQGKPIGALDTLITAHALSLEVTLVTNNIREFSRVPDLGLANWVED